MSTRHVLMCLPPLALAAGPVATASAQSPVPSPHPLICEVLAAVPSGPRGDASGDGSRDAIGDEFIELVNPHDRSIQLKGYTLVDADAWQPAAPRPDKPGSPGTAPSTDAPKPKKDAGRAELRFVFPEVELKPHQVVVVFNGYKQRIPGNAGDADKAPAGTNEKFHDAWVFTMKNESPYAALSNEGDFVVLIAPDGKPVQVVKWGTTSKNPPKEAGLVEEAPESMGSVQRDGVRGKLTPHRDLKGDLKGTNFSPGVFSLVPSADAPPVRPSPSGPGGPPGKPGTPKKP